MAEVWREYDGPAQDTIDVEIYQSWLQEPGEADFTLPTTAAAASKSPNHPFRRLIGPSSEAIGLCS